MRKLRQMCDDAGVSPWIEVDGGISGKNAYKVWKVSLAYSQTWGKSVLIVSDHGCSATVTVAEQHVSED